LLQHLTNQNRGSELALTSESEPTLTSEPLSSSEVQRLLPQRMNRFRGTLQRHTSEAP
ncbi:hypothetical protein A2U01_0087400, partial [Trifolium medium]|nr:hypothetical protein [Trifolium medium]